MFFIYKQIKVALIEQYQKKKVYRAIGLSKLLEMKSTWFIFQFLLGRKQILYYTYIELHNIQSIYHFYRNGFKVSNTFKLLEM